jgi:hypothetical protein
MFFAIVERFINILISPFAGEFCAFFSRIDLKFQKYVGIHIEIEIDELINMKLIIPTWLY